MTAGIPGGRKFMVPSGFGQQLRPRSRRASTAVVMWLAVASSVPHTKACARSRLGSVSRRRQRSNPHGPAAEVRLVAEECRSQLRRPPLLKRNGIGNG
jgi:hypothetical protein